MIRNRSNALQTLQFSETVSQDTDAQRKSRCFQSLDGDTEWAWIQPQVLNRMFLEMKLERLTLKASKAKRSGEVMRYCELCKI